MPEKGEIGSYNKIMLHLYLTACTTWPLNGEGNAVLGRRYMGVWEEPWPWSEGLRRSVMLEDGGYNSAGGASFSLVQQ